MWKTLFGNISSEKLEEIKNQLENSEKKIFPILKPGDWVGLNAGAIRQTLVGNVENPKVVIGFGYDTPENFIFLTNKDLEKMNENEILREAYLNLENYDVPINEIVPNKIVIIDGKDFCSEKILDKKFLLQMHEKLNSENLIVSIPRRRCMMITAISEGEEIENQFISVHNNTWNDPSYGNAPITKNLFVITKGKINGCIEL